MNAAALGAVGMLVMLGMYAAAAWIGAVYNADETPLPHPPRDDEDTQPWPAPR